jgi:hypothetical protein
LSTLLGALAGALAGAAVALLLDTLDRRADSKSEPLAGDSEYPVTYGNGAHHPSEG